MSLNSRIKERREELGMSRSELAKLIGVTSSAIANYENEISCPKVELLFKLFDALKCDANYLYQDEMEALYEDFKTTLKERRIIEKYRELDSYSARVVDSVLNIEYDRCTKGQEEIYETVMKPSFQACLSAGTGQFVFDDIPSELVEVPAEYKDIDFVIGVSGDSMEPTYFDGDKVMIKKQEVQIGQIGAFMINGVALLKELGENRLISHNKDYDDLLFDEYMKIDCIGKVIGKLN